MDFNLKINKNNNKKNNKKVNKKYSKVLHKRAYFESERRCNELKYDFYYRFEKLIPSKIRQLFSSIIETVFWSAYKLGRAHGENIATAEALETINSDLEVSDE